MEFHLQIGLKKPHCNLEPSTHTNTESWLYKSTPIRHFCPQRLHIAVPRQGLHIPSKSPQALHAPSFLRTPPHPSRALFYFKAKGRRGGDERLGGLFTHKHTHTHTHKHTHAAPAHLTPAPHQPPPWPCPQLPAQNTHGNRSWPPDISSSQCGCWAARVSMGTAGP